GSRAAQNVVTNVVVASARGRTQKGREAPIRGRAGPLPPGVRGSGGGARPRHPRTRGSRAAQNVVTNVVVASARGRTQKWREAPIRGRAGPLPPGVRGRGPPPASTNTRRSGRAQNIVSEVVSASAPGPTQNRRAAPERRRPAQTPQKTKNPWGGALRGGGTPPRPQKNSPPKGQRAACGSSASSSRRSRRSVSSAAHRSRRRSAVGLHSTPTMSGSRRPSARS
ncbi:MAG: hypothetical protein RL071_2230, partial [Pseudomonadota bacterium]